MMRILFLESHPMWIHGLPNGFRDAGHDVKISGPLSKKNMPSLVDFHPDLIFTIGWGPENTSQKKQKLIKTIVRRTGAPHIYWATEDPTHTESFTLPYLYQVEPDFVFTICPHRVDDYRKIGILAAHIDFGYHQSIHNPVASSQEYSNQIAVVANAYPKVLKQYPHHYRHNSLQLLVRPLLEHNYRIDFYGKGWEDMEPILGFHIPDDWIHGYLSCTEANKVYSSSDIILGLQNHQTQLTQRSYEILGSGGFLLTDDIPEIRRLFTPNYDLIVSSSPEHTVQQVKYYLENESKRLQIRKQGNITIAKHNYKKRAESILKSLKKYGIFEGNTSRFKLKNAAKNSFIHEHWERYTICSGDTLWSISQKFSVPVGQLMQLNGLTSHAIVAGQTIKIKKISAPSNSTRSILIHHGEKNRKQVALTYDAGDEAGATETLLDILSKHQVNSTFFLTGQWVEKNPMLAKRLVEEGHEIGNHSYDHPDFTKLTDKQIRSQVKRCEKTIMRIIGKSCRPLFRPPYGEWNKQVLKSVGASGYKYCVHWSIDTVDWKLKGVQNILDRILKNIKHNDIVLMHLQYLETAQATDIVIPLLKEQQFELVTVGELLHDSNESGVI